jgi:hypothetical protein
VFSPTSDPAVTLKMKFHAPLFKGFFQLFDGFSPPFFPSQQMIENGFPEHFSSRSTYSFIMGLNAHPKQVWPPQDFTCPTFVYPKFEDFFNWRTQT